MVITKLKTLFYMMLSAYILNAATAETKEKQEQLLLPCIVGNNMVLQRDKPLPIRGKAPAGKEVIIRFKDQIKKVVAGADGSWKIILDPMSADVTPSTMTISCGTKKKNSGMF